MVEKDYGDKMIKIINLISGVVVILLVIYGVVIQKKVHGQKRYLELNSPLSLIFLPLTEKVVSKHAENKYIKGLIETASSIYQYHLVYDAVCLVVSKMLVVLSFAVVFGINAMFMDQAVELNFLLCVTTLYILKSIYNKFVKDQKEILENMSRDLESLCKQLSILISTGLSIDDCFKIISATKHKSLFLTRLFYMIEHEFKKGGGLIDGVSIFARYFRSKHFNKLIIIIVATKEKGVSKPSEKLLDLANEIQLERRFELKRKSEKISSKLLMPLMLSLVGIMAMLLVPAFLQFNFA